MTDATITAQNAANPSGVILRAKEGTALIRAGQLVRLVEVSADMENGRKCKLSRLSDDKVAERLGAGSVILPLWKVAAFEIVSGKAPWKAADVAKSREAWDRANAAHLAKRDAHQVA